MLEVLLRSMTIEDIEQVRNLEKNGQITPWSENAFRECLRVGYDAYVLEMQKIILGYIIFYVKVGECHILNFCVDVTQREQGYGTRLLNHAVEMARQKSAQMIFLEVRTSNYVALQMYRRLGFNEMGTRKNYYANPDGTFEDALMLGLQLTI